MDVITKLADIFATFPGIGKRQSKRFVYFLLTQNKSFLDTLVRTIQTLQQEIVACESCQRFFPQASREANVGKETTATVCTLCADAARDTNLLMVVEKDVDLENIEKSGAYKGHYFVLGGTVPILEDTPPPYIRSQALSLRVKTLAPQEVILAMSATPEGENTAQYVRNLLTPLQKKKSFVVSTLGRGLSTGTELEYSDADTITSALSNRRKS